MNASKHYLALDVNHRINLRSGFDIAIAYESGTYNRFAESITCCKDVADKCTNVQYDLDRRGWCSLRTLRWKAICRRRSG